jgi:serine protease Do
MQILATAAVCWNPMGVLADSMTAEDIYTHVLPSIVTLKVRNSSGDTFTGSAFLAMAQDVAVTAWHVVQDAVEVTALFSDGERSPVAGVIDRDELRDLAIISLKSGDRPLIKLEPTQPRIGSKLYVIGAPRGFGFSIADGLLSQVQQVDGIQQYQVSCPFSTGNSGSPILNSQAQVIGTASWTKLHAQNLNFAIPAAMIARMNPHQPPTPWLHIPLAAPHLETRPQSTSVTDKPQETAGDWKALGAALREAAGQPVTVIVRRPNEPERSFSFVVPPGGK